MKSLEKNKKNPKKVSEISEIIMPPEDSSPPNPKVEENNPPKKPAFFMPSNIAAKYFTNLDQCCCADVPCLSIIKEYCESRLDKIFELSSRVCIKGENLEQSAICGIQTIYLANTGKSIQGKFKIILNFPTISRSPRPRVKRSNIFPF